MIQKFPVSPLLAKLAKTLVNAGGKPIAVGGCVRDFLMGQKPKDIDVEVYKLSIEDLEKALESVGKVFAVGRSFGVLKVKISQGDNSEVFDVALPRTENKKGQGHRGFVVSQNPNMPFEEAAKRRDFTVNAMGIDLETMELQDAHQGQKHLAQKRLQHVSDAFDEDPLRVLRGCQFAARFGFELSEETLKKCQNLASELKTLPKERIFEEMKKLLLAKTPSLGLEAMQKSGALSLFPELECLMGCPQDPEWHPEGDVWVHNNMVVDEAAKIAFQNNLSQEEHLIIVLGALCHDLGKPSTTREEGGRIRSKAHEEAGKKPTQSLLIKMGMPQDLIDQIIPLVVEHLKPMQLYKVKDQVGNAAIRRLSTRVNVQRLCYVAEADFLGRTTKEALEGIDPSAVWLLEKARDLAVENEAPKAILQGRDLIKLGEAPGPKMGKVLKKAYDAQIEGVFSDLEGALAWLNKKK